MSRELVGKRLTGAAAFLVVLVVEVVAWLKSGNDPFWTSVFFGAPFAACLVAVWLIMSGRGQIGRPVLAGTFAAIATVAIALGVFIWYLLAVVRVS